MKIFLLEDDFSLNRLICNALEQKGFFVTSVDDGYDAMTHILNNKYDLYILDINVPGFSGHEVLEEIRKINKSLPVIIVSAQLDMDNISKAYDLGCNDYLKKPFELEELLLHIKYHIKTLYKNDIDKDIIDLGYGFSFDLKDQTLYKHEHEIILTQKEKLLLTLFIHNLDKTVSSEMIHEYVWDNKEMEAVSMRSMIHKLQKKLKSGMIVNIRGVGYKLMKKEFT
ncbi:response regulator transcription factor [Halarcobacter anaerophilus]|jgi:DNA-binding response OmpR family regulator|uniref:DNA-binding response regulator n=1 Tax=Halarcobacter anaerophilus TaxID=877500 RepID=A0A4Q0Y373_9BACT|nr:response regulator transcription factor [Halarcobacter anaerophilus]QDF27571.1 two-component system response regulator [Halarcobacter anaerophilus]RXJ63925.1 DNA-binding response regulator [Halarcobacter anaerophilus]